MGDALEDWLSNVQGGQGCNLIVAGGEDDERRSLFDDVDRRLRAISIDVERSPYGEFVSAVARDTRLLHAGLYEDEWSHGEPNAFEMHTCS